MQKSLILAAASLCIVAPAVAQSPTRSERVQFPRGASSQVVRGTIRGYSSVDYIVGARAGQTLRVSMRTGNASAYFNVIAPGAQNAMFIGSNGGNRFSGRLPQTGDYRVRIYLMRNAARRGESATYALDIGVSGQLGGPGGPGYPGGGPGSGSGQPIPAGNMGAYCRGEAAGLYGLRPAYVRTGRLTAAPGGGTRIEGTADKGREGAKRFRCRFDARNRFIEVMPLDRDGE
ncbi:hypothetical protein [Sphingomonas koreensis]